MKGTAHPIPILMVAVPALIVMVSSNQKVSTPTETRQGAWFVDPNEPVESNESTERID